MDPWRNPYSPGAGCRPPHLAGRQAHCEALARSLERSLLGREVKSQFVLGQEGTGKTVLLAEYGRLALEKGLYHEHIDLREESGLVEALVAAVRRLLLAMAARRRGSEPIKRALEHLQSFSQPRSPRRSPELAPAGSSPEGPEVANDLAALWIELGEACRQHATGALLTIDELHLAPRRSLETLLVALEEGSRARLPVMVAAAAVASPAALAGGRARRQERFDFAATGPLESAEARRALTEPAAAAGVSWEEAALERAVELSGGFAYFLQALGHEAWNAAPAGTRISGIDLEESLAAARAAVEDHFFSKRATRASAAEELYLRAMAELAPTPLRSVAVAQALGRRATAVAPVRDSLIRQALCYAPRWGEIDFALPFFDLYLRGSLWLPETVKI